MAIRLAHHSFTLGELGFATFGGAIVFMESLHVTIAQVRIQFVDTSSPADISKRYGL